MHTHPNRRHMLPIYTQPHTRDTTIYLLAGILQIATGITNEHLKLNGAEPYATVNVKLLQQ